MLPVIVQFDKKKHDNSRFDCGITPLNRYLKEQAGQDMRHHYASLFVAVDESGRVLGFYTLSSTSIDLCFIPAEVRKKLPKYPMVPGIRLGRLAVDISAQGQHLGTALIANSILRSMSNVADWAVIVVDAKGERAAAFYEKIGFSRLLDDNLHLFIMRSKLSAFIVTDTSS